MKDNRFIHRIDKEDVNRMPLAEFGGEVVVIRTPEALPEALAYLNRQTCVGVDTETRPSFVHGQHYPTALVQIATEERCYLFQLKHIGFPEGLAQFFANPDICKVGLAFRDDLRGLQRLRPFRPANCADIQQMVLKYGILDLGLQKIFAIIFGRKISKSQQLTNWENAVLTPEQARYASTDAWATLLIYKELQRTRQLTKRQYEALRRADIERQIQHQQEVMAQKKEKESHEEDTPQKA
ncbi:MAG: 3'-5' exonuclease domain-containing protein 2 [Paludibacteraceae bacterium]|nr:3'-5' exonuclease domain-containing protein 2 [Paludibacteraceae bacterium]